MYFERRELIQSLDLLSYLLFVYIWLLDGRTLWLAIRAILQVQICNLIYINPTWSLSFSAIFLCSINALFAIVCIFGPPIGSLKQSSILLDFVGQQTQPTKLHALLVHGLICYVQLVLLVVAFEHGQDELKPDDEASSLDPLSSTKPSDAEEGQGWDARDEEASLFAPDTHPETKDPVTSLSHPIAVIRLGPVWQQIWQRGSSPSNDDSSPHADPSSNLNSTTSSSSGTHFGTHDTNTSTNANANANAVRPDTSRIRRFSRRHRPSHPTEAPSTGRTLSEQPPSPSPGPGSASVDDSWPPMWLVIARNMVGPNNRLVNLRPARTVTTLRNGWANRFGRNLSNQPQTDPHNHTPPHSDSPNA
ncbi:hypothetical protein BCV70DRAFT_202212 [Testicularia cyperi]|uniref:DUF1746 domain-containing protein n=1 Tax=Testicularia cyperi TaxID=1882483 RepID=A0A317XIC9_9BASI|nr:hypothetical protein BCV70DRAFT_202212 [Testicularia cyperi]